MSVSCLNKYKIEKQYEDYYHWYSPKKATPVHKNVPRKAKLFLVAPSIKLEVE